MAVVAAGLEEDRQRMTRKPSLRNGLYINIDNFLCPRVKRDLFVE